MPNNKRLYIDDFVIKQGFNSTEEYIENCIEEMRPPHFDKLEYFNDLLKKGIISEWFYVRTSDAGRIDRTYYINNEGNLVGITEGPYPGEEGIFRPEEILRGNRISDGYTIESRRFNVKFREWLKNNK